MTSTWYPSQYAEIAPPPARPPMRPAVRPRRFVVDADPANLLPPPRLHIGVEPFFPGDKALAEEARLIRDVAARKDGWVYFANWYAMLATKAPAVAGGGYLPQPLLWPIVDALRTAAAKGATICGLLWDVSLPELDRLVTSVTASVPAFLRPYVHDQVLHYAVSKTNHDENSTTVGYLESLHLPNTTVRLDTDTLQFGSHHQKFLVVGNSEQTVAVVGGVDMNRNRIVPVEGSPGTPYFDISVRIDGEAAADVADLFERRWRANPRERRRDQLAESKRRRPAPAASGGATVQLGVNFGCGKPLSDVPNAVRGANALIRNVLSNCSTYFYAEDQYGIGNDELKAAIDQAFRNGARFGIVVLADSLGVDDEPEIEYRRHIFWTKFPQIRNGQLLVFQRRGDDGVRIGSHAYVHSKLVIVDDLAATIASVNMNNRSWYNDSEIAVAITDAPEKIRRLRMDIWREHLKPRNGVVPESEVADPVAAYRLWKQAYDNPPGFYDPGAWRAPRPRLTAVTFASVPERASPRIISWIKSRAADAVPVVGAVAGLAVGYELDSQKRTIDDIVDFAYTWVFDPKGPERCRPAGGRP